MNNISYSLNTLRIKIRDLQKQNSMLKKMLAEHNIIYDDFVNVQEEDNIEYIDDQGHLIDDIYITEDMAAFFLTLFQGRRDVYALRGSSGGYYPQCKNRWSANCPKQHNKSFNCSQCSCREMLELTRKVGLNHLLGYKENCTDVLAIYPLTEDGMCRFIVFDFDNHDEHIMDSSYQNEVDALRHICQLLGVDVLVERSRSGSGAHLWILFSEFVPATIARTFGFLLLDKGMTSINLSSFKYYDRMFPSQDHSDGFGNVIALPLQGRALKQGNSVFVDDNWNAYTNQWDVLLNYHKLSRSDLERYIETWRNDYIGKREFYDLHSRPRPWRKDVFFNKEDVDVCMCIICRNGLFIDALNLSPRIQNQIRSLATFDNPIYYKNIRTGHSNWNQSSFIYMGEDIDDYIHIPRGLYDMLIGKCMEANIPYQIIDERERGKPINVVFSGRLREQQVVAARILLSYDDGVLNAATAFGKTVIGSYIISQRKINTLIIVPRVSLCEQWIKELHDFLIINENPPTYKTKGGKTKIRNDIIGELHANKNTLTGIIDVVTVGSLYKKGEFNEYFNNYGMVIVDECHHGASHIYERVLSNVNAKYIYGFSSNAKRIDRMEKKVYMLLGNIRHKYTTRQRVDAQQIQHYVLPRFTSLIEIGDLKNNLNKTYEYIITNQYRNDMIINDVIESLKNNRTPLILTKYKSHAEYLYQRIKSMCDNTYLIYGNNSVKKNSEIREILLNIGANVQYVLVATGQSIGEGFNLPRLDTLFLAMPISNEPVVDQYIGRVHRDYQHKESAIIYDYVDSHLGILNNMYKKRLRAYKKFGYSIVNDINIKETTSNYIYNQNDYLIPFEIDIHNTRNRIILCSRTLSLNKVKSFINSVKPLQERGVEIIVLVQSDEESQFIYMLKSVGVYVELIEEIIEQFCIIDDLIVWHGSMSLLGREDIYDSLIRIESVDIAVELLQIYKNNLCSID